MILIPFACFIFGGAVVYLYFAYKEREPKTDNDARKFAMAMSEKVEKQLREENAELKAEIENDRDLPIVAYMQGAENQKNKDKERLTKATEIIRQFLNDYPVITKELLDKLEQFIKEVEK